MLSESDEIYESESSEFSCLCSSCSKKIFVAQKIIVNKYAEMFKISLSEFPL